MHIFEKHEFECEHRCVQIIQGDGFDYHMLQIHKVNKHPYTCETCGFTCLTKAKVWVHICKADLKNSTFDTLYTKSWYNKNVCNPIYCTRLDRDVAWLHDDKCWSHDVSCFNQDMIAKQFVKHFKTTDVIKGGVIFWSEISEKLST